MTKTALTSGIKTIIVVNTVATVVTILFWSLVLIKVYGTQSSGIMMDNVSKGSTLGFLVADCIWAVPLLIISIYGLLKRSVLGWLVAQLVNILWCYSLTSLWVRDSYLGMISPGDYIFLPFTIFSLWSIYYLWNRKNLFGIGSAANG
ncbi:MAG TPA: hypothetical protein VHO70_07190 [Chitinispirillaceae bacterium]|nr:hypothetical protein [Chitinispirillaceae bacterium]